MASEQQSEERTSQPTEQTFVQHKIIKEKVIFTISEDGTLKTVKSKQQKQIGPTLIRDFIPGESSEPCDEDFEATHQIGDWRRQMQAIRRFGYDGEKDYGE